MKKIFILLFLLLSFSLAAQEIEHSSVVDWEKGSITITAVYHGGYSPQLRTNGEKALDSYIDNFFKEKILTVQYDSFRTIQDIAITDPEIMNAISDLGLQGEKTSSKMSNNLSSLEITYTYRLYPDIIDIFIKNSTPLPVYPLLSFTPAAKYTGVVILVYGNLPVQGEYNRESSLNPSLFPKIWDEKMRLVYSSAQADPESLSEWGAVQFSETLDEDKYRDRIGYFPIHMSAKAVFGTDTTDIVLHQEDADKLLANSHNIELMENGKILIIIVPEKL